LNPPSVWAGETVNIGLTIRRQGGTGNLADVAVDFYLGVPGTGTLIGRGTASSIAPNGTAPATIPWIPPSAGRYTISALIDPDGAVPEDPENNLISRSVQVLRDPGAVTPPMIDSFTINDGTPNTHSTQVALNVSASSGVPAITTPSHLLFVEYEFIQSRHDWVPVGISPWLPYAIAHAGYTWELQPAAGVHYLQVWAADPNGLISLKPLETFINYLPSQAHVATQQIRIYHYPLALGEALLARLTSFAPGDGDLYAWDPNGNDVGRSESSDPVEEVGFTAGVDGIHQVEVEGYTSVDFLLEIIPSTMLRTGSSISLRTGPSISLRTGPSISLRTGPSTMVRTSQAAGILSPTPRGRGIPLTVTVPDEDIGLPEVPELQVFLPVVVR